MKSRKTVICQTILIISALLFTAVFAFPKTNELVLSSQVLIPKEIDEFARKIIPKKFSDKTYIRDYIMGFSEGFKSSLICKSSHLQRWSGNEATDIGWKEGRRIGLTESLPDELRGINLTHYGFIDGIVEGLVYFNFEQSDFRPLNSSEVWWIGNCEDIPGYNDIQKEAERKKFSRLLVYIKTRGQYSPESSTGYGHMGIYSREIFITKILEVRPSTERERAARKESF